jgi:hydrogenase small subunit
MLDGTNLPDALERRGVSRREFIGFCSAMLATLALPQRYLGAVAEALTQATRPVVVWLEFQDCAGNTESVLRSSDPPVADIVLDLLSWEYHETIMAGAGKQAEAALHRVVNEEKGKYIALVEGSIPTADGGVYCTIGGRSALDIATEVCSNAAVNIAVGACAWDGGLVRSSPNPTGAVGLQEAVPGINVVNLGGCPHNVANTAAVLVHYLTFKKLPPLDQYNRPLFAYGNIIHDQCERRAHYDAGRFVEEWGDIGSRKGWCLYKMGCKGPDATYNCPTVRWNQGTSWPVKSGHGCIACASNRFWDTMSPFYKPLPSVPGFGVDTTAEKIGWGVVGATAALTAAHGLVSIARNRRKKAGDGQPEEEQPEQKEPVETES